MSRRTSILRRAGALAIFAIAVLLGAEVVSVSAYAGRGGRGGGRGAARAGGHRSYSGNRGSVRRNNHGSVRHHRPSSSRGRPSAGRGGSNRRPSTGGRRTSRPAVQRTPHQGSVRNADRANRAMGQRGRQAANRDRTLRDIVGNDGPTRPNRPDRPDRPDGPDRPDRPGHPDNPDRPGRPDRPDHWPDRGEIRDKLSDLAHRYPWGGGYYYWDDGYWYDPYYDGDDVGYVEVYPPEGLVIEEFPVDDAELVETDDGDLYLLNGVYYTQLADGTFQVLPALDDGLPDPVTIVRDACDFIAQQPAFTLVLSEEMDHLQDDGMKVRAHTQRSIDLKRPDRLAARSLGDDINRSFWYDGFSITIFDQTENVFAREDAPETVDETLDFVVGQLSVSLPFMDLLYADPYAGLQSALANGEHLGLMVVDDVSCHHLQFSTDAADWEIWIEAGDEPRPKMLSIRYMGSDEQPTYTGRIQSWDFAPDFGGTTFTAIVPDGVEQIRFTTHDDKLRKLEAALRDHQSEHQRASDYIEATRSIELWSQVPNNAEAAERVATEQARLKEIGEVSEEEVEAYEKERSELQRQLREARRDARR